MKHASLFSGIGGFDLAAEWMGWENVFHCEWNEFGKRVLKYYWPNAISYDDITKTDFTIHRGTIDVLTGGFPCQPYSLAGLRKGKEDERHLWPEMLRAIREIKPRWVVGENVLGLVGWNDGMVFEEVQADLEAEGYEVQPYILPAASVDAPHRRDRVWFVAYAKVFGGCSGFGEETNISRRSTTEYQSEGSEIRNRNKAVGRTGISADTTSEGLQESRQTGFGEYETETGKGMDNRPEQYCRNAANNNKQHGNLSGFCSGGIPQQQTSGIQGCDVANSNCDQRCEGGVYTDGPKEAKRHPSSCSTWNSGGNWQDFPTQPPVCDGDDGFSSRLDGITFSKWRNESIKAGGNAIVPQVIHQIFKAIKEYENNHNNN